jgi:Kef-type K+ transport system membrane component KefB/nucleotide-binding universal stress UspA family protein
VHDSLLVFWVQLFVLLGAAHGLGALARRFGQPPVIGALGSGLLLSSSVFGALWPEGHAWLFPVDPIQESLLQGVAWVGVGLLLVITGFETDLELVRRLGRAAFAVAAGSLLVPFATGLSLGFAVPETLIGEGASRPLFALFLATALGLSSLPIIARVLSELDLMRRNFGQITLAVAAANDVVGWVMLGAITGAARSNDLAIEPLLRHFASVAVYMILVFVLGQRVVDALLRRASRRGAEVAGPLSVTILVALALGALAQLAGLEAILGAFVAGILCARSRFQPAETFGRIESLTAALFAPLFFASAGLRADLAAIANPTTFAWGLLLLGAATAAKFVGSMAGARVAGLHPREGAALGAALNAQGAVGLVVATVGLGAGVLTPSSYTIVVLIALATSMMAPPMLRVAARHWQGSEEEIERLARERRLGSNLLVRPERILLPTHGGPNSVLAARILDLAWPEGAKVTVFTAGDDVPAADLRRVLAHFEKKPAEHVHARGDDALPAILEQASHGYGAIVVGATDRRAEGRLASTFVDRLLAASPVPVLMIRRGVDLQEHESEEPSFRRVLVPALATLPGRAAQEVAFGIAKRLGAEALLAHVVTTPAPQDEIRYSRSEWRPEPGVDEDGADAPWLVARRVMDEAQARAREIGVAAETAIRIGISAPRELLALSREAGADLIVLPASLRQLSERPFLGYGVEYLLSNSEATIVVVSMPAGWRARGARREA